MPTAPANAVLRHIRRLAAAEEAALPDAELLKRFAAGRDESAFAAIVDRHGPMVLGLCRRMLNEHDAEDALQATFLVLARKASAIRKGTSLASWLYGVAHRIAGKLRKSAARHPAPQAPLPDVPQPQAPDPSWREVQAVLDEELRKLPERFRAPLVLCYLEGRTRDEAARDLGWSVTTFRGRLERGRNLLRKRLTRRGLPLPAALLGVGLSEAAVSAALPAGLAETTVRAVLSAVPGGTTTRAVLLAGGVLKTMLFTRIAVVAGAVLLLAALGFAGGELLPPVNPGGAPHAAVQPPAKPEAPPAPRDPAREERRKLRGKWVELQRGTPELPFEGVEQVVEAGWNPQHAEWQITEDQGVPVIVIRVNGQERFSGMYEVNPSSPAGRAKKIVLYPKWEEGSKYIDPPAEGVYELNGDRLRVFLGWSAFKAPPHEFPKGGGLGRWAVRGYVHELRRVP